MAKLNRLTAKIFGETASTTNTPKEIGQFGSAKAGTYNATGDVATIQSLPAWTNGWIDAVTPTDQFPPLPEMTGVHKVLSYQNAYLLQQGIPEWDSATTYYENGFCSYNGIIYKSLIDENINNQPDEVPQAWFEYGSGDYANQDINNLTTFGNARLQYAPFAINAGTVINGNNHTLQSGSFIQSYAKAGSYTIEITEAGNYEIEMYGAGGGVCGNIYTPPGAGYNIYNTASGGSGAGFKGVLNLPVGEYTITVGAYGINGDFRTGGSGNTSGGNGTATVLEGIIAAGGGNGGSSTSAPSGNGGAGGILSILDSSKIVSSTLSSNGNVGTYATVSGLSGHIANAPGGLSLYDNSQTGYGAGGGKIGYSPAYNAQNGYFKITKLTGDASKIFCDPCTITTCDGKTKIFDIASTIDVSSQPDGSYLIFKDYETGELSLADDLIISKTEKVIYYSTSIIPQMTSATTPEGTVTTTGSNWSNGWWKVWGADPDNPSFDGQPAGISGTSSNTYTFESAVLGKGKFSFYQGGNSTYSYCANYSLTAIFEDDTEDTFYTATNLIYPLGTNTGLRDNVELNYNKNIKAFRCTVTMAGSNNQAGTGYAAFRYYEAIDASDVYWLDTSTTPANLRVNGEINNALVYIGECTINSGGVDAITNREFNNSGYLINPVYRYLTETYSNGASWYRVYAPDSTGYQWCEQGGKVLSINAQSSTTVSFLKPFKSSDYTALTADNYNGSGATGNISIYILSATQLKIWNSNGASRTDISWQAKGYIN